MTRIITGLVLGAIFLAALIYTTLDQTGAECTVCIEFRGKSQCETAAGPDVAAATAQAATGACTFLSGGVTDSIRCTATTPVSVKCSENSGY
jgi:hypothetical protein